MKKILFFIFLFGFFLCSDIYSGPVLRGILSNSKHHRTNSGGDEATCPECNRRFVSDINNYARICTACDARNSSSSNFCADCGKQLENKYIFVCPHCDYEFIDFYGSGYSDSYEEEEEEEDNRPRNRHRRHNRENSNQDRYSSRTPQEIDSFTKANYEDDIRQYNISNYTGQRAFSKVVVDTAVTQQWCVIINVIKVFYNNTWNEIPISARLHEGRNEFSVNIPEGSGELIIAFNHGQGCRVTVSLE